MKTTKELNLKNKNSGITLIALVITIIVMLILVAVTVTMAVNGGLFGHAQTAAKGTNKAIADEQALGNGKINIAAQWYNSPQEYVNTITGTGDKGDGTLGGETTQVISKEQLIQQLQSKNVGEKYTLRNVEYVVVAIDEEAAVLIASKPLGSVTLGAQDNSVSGSNSEQRALNSYNNAYYAIQRECERVSDYDNLPDNCSVRSVEYKQSGGFIVGTFFYPPNNDGEISCDVAYVQDYVDTSVATAWYATRITSYSGAGSSDINYYRSC